MKKEKNLKDKLDSIPNIKKLKATIILFHS
ncbi:homoserine dehydrogenase [Clostridium botulinum CFSAN002367]|nr:homoserine dehydrogenase [Clostridium botulinum CFSAN002367]